MIEAVMLVALGFLSATLLALAAVPALARRADRLARRRAEAAFPLSLAEIAADRDHLRAELALRARGLEQQAERGFAVKAGAMQEIGRRDMAIGQLEWTVNAREGRIAELEGQLAATQSDLSATSARLAGEIAAHAASRETLDKRVADLAAVEHSLAETRSALTGTSGDLAARSGELAQERATLGRVEALLAGREAELAVLRTESDALRVLQVEGRTQILVLEGKRDELSIRLAATEATLKATTADRDAERLRGDALDARASQAESGLSAANAASVIASAEAARIDGVLGQEILLRQAAAAAQAAAEAALAEVTEAGQRDGVKRTGEIAAMKEDLREREQRLETLHAEIVTLQGALSQARTDRLRLKRELAKAGKGALAPVVQDNGHAALRQEIMKVAERLMTMPPKQEAAE